MTEDAIYSGIRSFYIALASIGGTSFREANLTDVNLYQGKLNNSGFRDAKVTHANLYRCQRLDRARCGGTILDVPVVRDLAATHNGRDKDYTGQNLKGINLCGANLSGANLTEADLSDAILEKTILERANLSKIQALRTQFRQANLTAACLEAWTIDSTTQLQDVICDHVYLLNNQQERRPNSGNFAPGEFTKLFQEVLDTIDLIFRDGVDWRAFVQTFRDIQVQNEDTDLVIQSIENKGDGVVVVKVQASGKADKAKIHAEFSETYQVRLQALEAQYRSQLEAKDSEITSYRRENANMLEITKLLANKRTIKQINYGGNNFQSDISGGQVNQAETVTAHYTTDQQKTLTKISQEIQALLESFSAILPQTTVPQHAQLAQTAADQARENHALAEQLLSALKDGMEEAIAHNLNHSQIHQPPDSSALDQPQETNPKRPPMA